MKGSLQDVAFLFSMIFGFMFAVAIVWPIASAFFTQFQTLAPNSAINQSIGDTNAKLQEGISAMDMGLPVIFFVLSALSLAAASQVKSHPAFFIVFLLVNVFTILLSGILQDIWGNVNTTGSQMLVWTPLFLQYAPKITVGLMLLMAIAVWVRE